MKAFSLREIKAPPSTNQLHHNRGRYAGRGRTKRYRNWIRSMDFVAAAQGEYWGESCPMTEWARIWIRVNPRKGSDITNRIKALEDQLERWRILSNDSIVTRCTITLDRRIKKNHCSVVVVGE